MDLRRFFPLQLFVIPKIVTVSALHYCLLKALQSNIFEYTEKTELFDTFAICNYCTIICLRHILL